MPLHRTHRPKSQPELFSKFRQYPPCILEANHPLTQNASLNIILRTRAATSRPGSTLRWRTSSSTLSWWRSNKREVYLDRLVQELRIMRTVNRSSCLVQSGVFDQRVTLASQVSISLIFLSASLPSFPSSRAPENGANSP